MGSERSPFLLFFCSHSWKTKNGNCNSNRVNTDLGGGEHLSVFRGVVVVGGEGGGRAGGGGGGALFSVARPHSVLFIQLSWTPQCASVHSFTACVGLLFSDRICTC